MGGLPAGFRADVWTGRDSVASSADIAVVIHGTVPGLVRA